MSTSVPFEDEPKLLVPDETWVSEERSEEYEYKNTCPVCGVLVGNREKHNEWHRGMIEKIEEVKTPVEEPPIP